MERGNIAISAILFLVLLVVVLLSFGTFNGVMAATNTTTATVSITISGVTQINFTNATFALGAGSVTPGTRKAQILTTGAGTVNNGSWTANGGHLILENIGNQDVALSLASDKNAYSLIGGIGSDSPDFEWNVSQVAADSCIGAVNLTGAFYDVNASMTFCTTFPSQGGVDILHIDFKLIIPSDGNITGASSATITATGTSA